MGFSDWSKINPKEIAKMHRLQKDWEDGMKKGAKEQNEKRDHIFSTEQLARIKKHVVKM